MTLYLERTYSKQTYPYTAANRVAALGAGAATQIVAADANRAIFIYKIIFTLSVASQVNFESGGILNILLMNVPANTVQVLDFYDYGIIGGYVNQNFSMRNAGGVALNVDWSVVYNYVRV